MWPFSILTEIWSYCNISTLRYVSAQPLGHTAHCTCVYGVITGTDVDTCTSITVHQLLACKVRPPTPAHMQSDLLSLWTRDFNEQVPGRGTKGTEQLISADCSRSLQLLWVRRWGRQEVVPSALLTGPLLRSVCHLLFDYTDSSAATTSRQTHSRRLNNSAAPQTKETQYLHGMPIKASLVSEVIFWMHWQIFINVWKLLILAANTVDHWLIKWCHRAAGVR